MRSIVKTLPLSPLLRRSRHSGGLKEVKLLFGNCGYTVFSKGSELTNNLAKCCISALVNNAVDTTVQERSDGQLNELRTKGSNL